MRQLVSFVLTAFLTLNLAAAIAVPAQAQYADQAQFGTASGTNALALTVPALAGVTTPPPEVPLRFAVPAANTGAVTITLNGGSAIAVTKLGASGLVAFSGGEYQAGMIATVIYDGTQYEAQNVAPNGGTTSAPQGAFAGLVVATTGNAATTITANAITLANSSGAELTVTGVNCSINEATTGAGGLDTGSLAASTPYYYWLISTGSATNCEASLQSTANSTFLSHLPSGYTYYARVGADLTDSAAHLWRVIQSGRRAHLVLGTDPATAPLMASGSTAGSWTAISPAAFVPPTADAIFTTLAIGAGASDDVYVGSNTSGTTNSTCGASQPATNSANMNFYCEVAIEGGTIAWSSNYGSANVADLGWEDNL